MSKFFDSIFGSNTVVNHSVGNNVTQITGNQSGTCTINGKTYKGNNISIIDGIVYIDGKAADESLASPNTTIIVKITGDVDSISTGSGDVQVTGNVNKISTGSGDVNINGSVYGSVKTGSGDINYNR